MSPGQGIRRKHDPAAAASGTDLTARYRGARARLMRPAMPPSFWQRPSCGPACWLPELIALNEDMRRLFLRATTRVPNPSGERIREVVAAHYSLTRIELIGASSIRRVAWPRQVAMYICARHAGLPSRDIAALFGDRDQSTVRFAVRAVGARQRRKPALAAEIAALIAKCRLGGAA
jgi:Bacterial dnaA protein helix-turn-helix